jgi:soluble lytic murein transglycosylase-like protein
MRHMSSQSESAVSTKISSWVDNHPENQQCKTPSGPILTDIADRRKSIMANTDGTFVVDENPDAKALPKPWYELDSLEEVTANAARIESLAYQYKLDPDFVRAIVWMESTHGWYDRFDPTNKTIRPMNVHATRWSQLGISRKDLKDPRLNIAAGVHILSAIKTRTAEPTNEKVATLYNQLGATKVNNYGKTVSFYATHKPWARKSLPTSTSCPSGCHYPKEQR